MNSMLLSFADPLLGCCSFSKWFVYTFFIYKVFIFPDNIVLLIGDLFCFTQNTENSSRKSPTIGTPLNFHTIILMAIEGSFS